MDSSVEILNDLIYNDTYKTLPSFLDRLDLLIFRVIGVESTPVDVIDEDFISEISMFKQTNVSLYFGKTLRDLKCVILDNNSRKHEMWLQYMGPKSLRILEADIPQSHIQNQDYPSLEEVISVFIKHVYSLQNYFEQLDKLNLYCNVIEPVRSTFKESYRKIHLAPRIYLQVEVSPNGSARNLHIVDQHEEYGDKPGKLLQSWDHDKDIATNVMEIIDLLNCEMPLKETKVTEELNQAVDAPICRICLCPELEEDTSPPQLLCSNPTCGIYLHRACLFEWFVQCDRGLVPPFGVASGTCPHCNQRIQCSKN